MEELIKTRNQIIEKLDSSIKELKDLNNKLKSIETYTPQSNF